ncbi:hypothetical protein I4U23_020918 [Adineta vaga]|nr:hypothetical protein I4U23_020918 [Adineta vaga]
MCKMDSEGNQSIYAIDEHGVCHLLEQTILSKGEEIIVEQSDRKQDFQQTLCSSISSTDEYFSTQPFSILTIHENTFSSSSIIKTSKKKKRKLRLISRRHVALKKQLKMYLKKKMKQQHSSRLNLSSNHVLHEQINKMEFLQNHQAIINDVQFLPDLSKRKYIYKDITLSNNDSNQINLRIFQCTQQQPSSLSISGSDPLATNDQNYHLMKSISSPDIRVGLSRHHGIKHLHKQISID